MTNDEANPKKYIGAVIFDFPVLALIFQYKDAQPGDFKSEFSKSSNYRVEGIKPTAAHTSVSIGLLGIKIPLKK